MTVLTHNAYWFQGYPSRWGDERVAEVPDVLQALIQLYAAADVDILCLQEVHDKRLAETIARELGMAACFHAPGGLRPDYGGAILMRHPAHFRDCTRHNGHPLHERVHLRAAFERDGERFELAVVHLPSNRFAGSLAAGDAARVAELTRILSEPPRPNLVVGDMNCHRDSPPYRLMLQAGYAEAAVLTEDAIALTRRVDYLWLDNACANRLSCFSALNTGPFCRTDPDGTPWSLSDHPPLSLALQ